MAHEGGGELLRSGVADDVPRVSVRVLRGGRFLQGLELLEKAGAESVLSLTRSGFLGGMADNRG